MSLYKGYKPKWIKLWDGDHRKKLNSEVVGFPKRNEDGYHMGGCYLYGYDPTHLISDQLAHHLDPRVVYIGTAGSSTFRGICSRTQDFTGTVIRGIKQKNPYDNGTLFRIKFGEKNRDNLYVAYYPMGYGEGIKIPAHGMEKNMIDEYRMKYGSLPCCDGPIDTKDRIVEQYKQLSNSDQKFILQKLEENANQVLTF